VQPKPALSLASLGRAPLISDLKQRLERVGNLKMPVLLTAEPGCGVELCARFLHLPNTPWVTPGSLSVLAEAPVDLLTEAKEGTLFLSEVGDLNRLEQKGLALLVTKLDKYNVRLVCASSKSLPELVAQGAFDSRLLQSLSGLTIRVPSLREHREDVPELANLFLSRLVEAREAPPRSFSTAALNALRNCDWPGNLSQLDATVKTLALTALQDEITLADVNRVLAQFDVELPTLAKTLPLHLTLREARDAFERVYFEHHIAREGGNMSRVAEKVGLERTHLYRKLKQLGVRLSRRVED
jgi:DNA-binding NtrC family response regulator